MKIIANTLLCCLLITLAGCGQQMITPDTGVDAKGHTPPTQATINANAKVLGELPFSNQQDFQDARQGLIARVENLQIAGPDGNLIWNQPAYQFITGESPASVNPSLWRQEKLNNIHGLFQVTKGVYQLRGFDLANMSIIEGESGWIIVDPLTTKETAAKALDFAHKHLGEHSISAIIFTHSHVDHFGGALGVMTADEAAANNVRIIAPKGFMVEATSENILAGPTMLRRSIFMYGKRLSRSERGHVGSGLGKGPAFGGNVGILSPTDIVDHTGQEMTIDGVRFVFQNASGSEAPAELTFYLPEKKAFCGAEIVSRHMHNLYTLRGAKVRDALAWSNFIDQVRELFGDAEVYFGCHHWPIWGKDRIDKFLKQQRDTYKYIHDQTLRLAHSGFTPREIAEKMALPESLRNEFSSRGYYGSLRHNSRAVYQAYFGWFDGNPANLNPLPPAESAERYLEYMGGVDNVLIKARNSFEKGEYRWVAEVLNHVVFAEPGNSAAKELLAATYDQLGYQSESAPWRDVYLTGAYELRHGSPEAGVDLSTAKELMRQTPLDRFFDALAARLNGPEADSVEMTVNFIFTDLNETHVLTIENAVLHHRKSDPDPNANATLKITHDLYLNMALGKAKIRDTVFSDDLEIEGSRIDLVRFFLLFDKPDTKFNIVVP
jgi:alkyl sulfatase BDS1-like metallo-beta-lactamase superfamily hydrolase